jgi:uncharacterized protein (TIGR02266 family)
LVDPNTRTGKRTPVTLKIKFKSETLEQFIERYAVDVSQGGIFIRTKEPLAVGTQMRFEFQLRDASPLIGGEGTVVWTRENDPSRPAIAPGMGVRFDRLAEGSQGVLERILAEKVKQAPQRTNEQTTKPPLFTDTPTRVAPAPVQDALLNAEKPRGGRRPDGADYPDQHTPLPKPMPFHSDADEFPDEAFEEATKVRALDELIAQTADGASATPPDELAARRGGRGDATLPDPAPLPPASATAIGVAKGHYERDSAPGLPNPPEHSPRAGAPRLLDTSPSPRTDPIEVVGAGRTKLGLDPPRLQAHMQGGPSMGGPSIKDAPTMPSGMRAVAAEPGVAPSVEAPRRQAAPILILVLVLTAAAAAAVWFFVLRERAVEEATTAGKASGSTQPGSGSEPGSGSAIASGSGSATEQAPPAATVDTVIASATDGATIEIVGTKQTGPAPLTAKLEKDKPYKARVIAPGFATLELDVKGGEPPPPVKLVPKPRVISVDSKPSGALILVDGSASGHTTPFDIELTKAQTAKKSVRITIRKGGFKPVDRVVAVADFTEDAAKMVFPLSIEMVAQVYRPPPPDRGSASTGSATPAGSNAGSDSAGSATVTPPPTGSGSATTPTTPPATGSGSATTAPTTPTISPPASGSGSAAATAPKTGSGTEPEPDFVKKP